MNRETSLVIAYAAIALSGAKYTQIPDTARWIAQDRDGLWWWYPQEPALRPNIWGYWTLLDNNVGTNAPLSIGTPPADFTQAIYKIY